MNTLRYWIDGQESRSGVMDWLESVKWSGDDSYPMGEIVAEVTTNLFALAREWEARHPKSS